MMHILESGESQGPFSPLRAIDFLITLALPFLGHVRLLRSTPQLPPPWSSAEYTSFGPLLSLQWMLGVLLTPVSGLVGKQKPVDRPARYSLGCPPCLPPPPLCSTSSTQPHGPQAWAQLSPCRSLNPGIPLGERGAVSCPQHPPPCSFTVSSAGLFSLPNPDSLPCGTSFNSGTWVFSIHSRERSAHMWVDSTSQSSYQVL